jgi:ABC-type arginine transport system permease subunit
MSLTGGEAIVLQATMFSLELGLQILITGSIVAGMWATFKKAGEPGWAAIIPIYNTYILIKIGDDAWWWLLLFFVPVINIIAVAKVSIDVADNFGKSTLFGLGVALLPFVCYPILGFGGSQYRRAT